MLEEGTYSVICIQIELFRSSKSGSMELTQIGAIAWQRGSEEFFQAINIPGLHHYLDEYKLGGDILKALHMSREDGGIFQFRSQFEIVEENEKIFCVDEKRALKDFLYFLDRYPNSILIGVDENSISVLVRKLKYLNFGM